MGRVESGEFQKTAPPSSEPCWLGLGSIPLKGHTLGGLFSGVMLVSGRVLLQFPKKTFHLEDHPGSSQDGRKWLITMVIVGKSPKDRVVGPLPNGDSSLINGGDPGHLQILG